MKKRFMILSIVFPLLLAGNNNSSACGSDNKASEIRDGVVTQMSTQMFIRQVWDYRANPKAFTYKGDLPCLIDFYADWCRPCRMVAPLMDEFAKEFSGKIRVFRVNTDAEHELSSLFQIRSIPMVMFVPKSGKPQTVVGALPKDSYKKMINDLLLNR
ncbi:MAG: thioredoxin domain-containing protein [Bacteroidales bacterium]|jgi:thioredoxin